MQTAKVEVESGKWILGNGLVRVEFAAGPTGELELRSLRNMATGRQWAQVGATASILLNTEAGQASTEACVLRMDSHRAAKCGDGGAELAFGFSFPGTGLRAWQIWRCFPGVAALECLGKIENNGDSPLPLVRRLYPFRMTVAGDAASFRLYGPDSTGRHGYWDVGGVAEERSFLQKWLVLQDAKDKECLLLGGDMAVLVLPLRTVLRPDDRGLTLIAGHELDEATASGKAWGYEVAPGQSIQTPLVFLAIAGGGPDEVANEAHRYLKKHVFPQPVDSTPHAVYGAWFTDPDAEALLLEEVEFARQIGFDVFVHDASWYEGSSLVPGLNDWSLGLGNYKDCPRKFPHGLAHLSRKVHEAGMKFGLWVDPWNVDAEKVAFGEIPESWLVRVDGHYVRWEPASLSPANQLCMGCPDVVQWIKKNLEHVVEAYDVDWMKWDPSCTQSYACDRSDHGHGPRSGIAAAYAGIMEVWDFLKERFPSLLGHECLPSLRHSRTNPGPRSLLPGGYINEFITGPMVSPYVWGSLAWAGMGDATDRIGHAPWAWFSASALDYNLRQHLCHGMTFGAINGSMAQRLSRSPQGYQEALRRGLLLFREYRHLLLENVFHPSLADPSGWEAVQYVDDSAAESVTFVFRNKGGPGDNVVRLKGLQADAEYSARLANLPLGCRKRMTGAALMNEGLAMTLPNLWLAKGDGILAKDYDDQLSYGSEIVLLTAQRV